MMGDFVVFGRLAAGKSKVIWSAILNAEDYVPSVPAEMPDGGKIVGVEIPGVEIPEVTFCEMMIRRLDYVTPPKIIRWGDR